ncbi:MAG: nitroreductase family protein, partial [Candidatus Omnitrophota bacterium]
MMQTQVYNLIKERRSVRLFTQREIPLSIVRKAIDAGRLAPSAANLQFIEYLVVNHSQLREKIFPHTRWAGYLWPKRLPPRHRRPVFYILILVNREKTKKPDLRDVGASAQNILLSLLAFGVASCWIASIDRSPIRKILAIPSA